LRKAFDILAGPPKGTGSGDRSNVVDLAEMRRFLDTFAASRDIGEPFPNVFLPRRTGQVIGAAITEADRADITQAVKRAFAGYQVWAGTVDGRAAMGTALDAKHAPGRDRREQAAIDRVLEQLLTPAGYQSPLAVAAWSGSDGMVQNGPDDMVLPHGTLAAYLDNAEGQGVLVITSDLGFRELQLIAQAGVGMAIGAFAVTQGVGVAGHPGQRLASAVRGGPLPLSGSGGPSIVLRFHGAVRTLDARYVISSAP
jgi:hypothetical protein